MHLVRRRDVVRAHDRDRAERLAEQILGADPSVLGRFAIRPGSEREDADDPERKRAALAEALAAGDLVLVRIDDAARPLDRPSVVPLSPLLPDDPIVPVQLPRPVGVRVVDYTGIAFADLDVTIEYPDGDEVSVRLDENGEWHDDAVRGSGPCRLRLPARLELPPEGRRAPPAAGFRRTPEDIAVPRRDARPVSLPLGRTHRVVVDPPLQQPTLCFPGGLFAFESAFPTAGISNLVKYAQELTLTDREVKIGLFGHADAKGDEGYNKELSDRRAEIAHALVTGDFDRFHAIAKEEPWQTEHYQALLRAIGCNPGAIDGELGVQSKLAIAAFRDEYNLGLFHRFAPRPRAFGDLPEGDALDDATKDAILDAFHADVAGTVAPDRFLGPGFSGCGEFNPRSNDDAENRRVTLAIYGKGHPEPPEFPCTKGDAGACEIDRGGQLRCRFYRERIGEEEPRDFDPFFDFEWLRTETGKAHVSVLTSLPDTNDAEIVVQVCEGGPPQEESGSGAGWPAAGKELVRIPAMVRLGVAYGLWDPAPYDPFDTEGWFGTPGDPEADPWLPGFAPPAFGIVVHGRWGWGGTPGHRLDRFHLTDFTPPVVLVRNDGKLLMVKDPEALRSAPPYQRAIRAIYPREGRRG